MKDEIGFDMVWRMYVKYLWLFGFLLHLDLFQFNDSIVLRIPGQEYEGIYDIWNWKCQGKGTSQSNSEAETIPGNWPIVCPFWQK